MPTGNAIAPSRIIPWYERAHGTAETRYIHGLDLRCAKTRCMRPSFLDSVDDARDRAASAANPGVLAGTVFQYTDRDGALDTGEPGMAGVTVTVQTDGGDTLVVTTGSDGTYSLEIPAGTTGIVVTDPAGYDLTTANRDQTVAVSPATTSRAGDVGYAVAGVTMAIPVLGPFGFLLLVVFLGAGAWQPLRRARPGR